MNKIKKTIILISTLAFSTLVFALVINMPVFDEVLLPEVKAIKNIKAKPYSEDNAYPALLAINSERQNFTDLSEEVRMLLNQNVEQFGRDYLNNDEFDRFYNNDADKGWQSEYPLCNSRRERGCMATLIEQVAQQPVNNDRLKAQLKKYATLIQYRDYSDATQMDMAAPLIAYGPIMALKRLYLADSYASNNTETFLQNYRQDMKFWRMLLRNGHHMITKMVAVASINDGIGALSKVIDDQELTDQQLRDILTMLPKLNQQEASMKRVFEYEFKNSIEFFEEAENQGEMTHFKVFDFFQPNATNNLTYQVSTKPLIQLSVLNAKEFYQKVNSEGWNQQPDNIFGWSPSSLYNPTGKILLNTGIPAYADYVARIHDLDGMITLLRLKIEVKLNDGRPAQAVIASSANVNPYTLEPMSYDKTSSSIYFDCVDRTSDLCEMSL